MIVFMNTAMPDVSDREFMVNIYESYVRLMYSTAQTICSQHSDCEEVVQDCFLKLIPKVGFLRTLPEKNMVYYLMATVRNTAYSLLRQQRRNQNLKITLRDKLEETSIEDENPVESRFLLTEQFEELVDCWKYLSEEEQFLLEGRYFLDFTDQQMAAQIGCKPSSIRMKLTRTRRKMQQYLLLKNEENPGYEK